MFTLDKVSKERDLCLIHLSLQIEGFASEFVELELKISPREMNPRNIL